MSEHNKWLAWKLKKGLAYRGRPAPMQPKGFLAKVLHFFYYRFKDVKGPMETNAVTFTEQVGGTLGPSGKTNGE
jgi:hypothetical protein